MPQFEFTPDNTNANHRVMLEIGEGKRVDTYYLKKVTANVDADNMVKLQKANKMSDVVVNLIWTPTRKEALPLPKDEAAHVIRDIPKQKHRTYHLASI